MGNNNEKKSLTALNNIKPLYFLPHDNLAKEVLIPALKCANSVNCMMGFFSSKSLIQIAPGLATFINSSNNKLNLIISPYLKPEDREAMEKGLIDTDDIISDFFEGLLITEDLIVKHTLRCLSYLIRTRRIEIKIALMKNSLFHPKIWIISEGDNSIVVHGSMNMTESGMIRNYEHVSVAVSWEDEKQRNTIEMFKEQFNKLWNKKEEDFVVLDLPDAVSNKIVKVYTSEREPTEEEFLKLYEKARRSMNEEVENYNLEFRKPDFQIPNWLGYESGPFKHQGLAVSVWCDAGYRGILAMATGSGKTITSMIAANKLYKNTKPLLIVIAAPYIPLIEQWCDEIKEFGLKPTDLTKVSGQRARNKELNKINRHFRFGNSEVEAIVVSHDTLCTKEFLTVLEQMICSRLLIADEVHNLGREGFIANLPEFFEYRLGLSATPERQYDEEGTGILYEYFGGVVFSYTLKEAIGNCLVEYDYYVHPVYLNPTEMDSWYEICDQIRSNLWRLDEGKPDDYLSKLYRDRRILLETAENKIDELSKLLDKEELRSLKYTLIYATDKAPEQLEQVNQLLNQKGILFHQLTSEETSQKDLCNKIIRSFQEGNIQILTAKRVLDEGVNIPQISKAFILASTTVERQWVQRRGRLLRICKEINKKSSIIHDFIALPPNMDDKLDDDAKKLIKFELTRIKEFAALAKNAGKKDGPISIIDKLVEVIY